MQLLDGALTRIPETYRLLGDILDRAAAAAERAEVAARILEEAGSAAAALAARGRPRVLYVRGPQGLETGLGGSITTEILEFIGAENVAATALRRGGLARISMEQVLAWNSDWVIGSAPAFHAAAAHDPLRRSLGCGARGAARARPRPSLRLGGCAALGEPPARADVAAGALRPCPARGAGGSSGGLPCGVLPPPLGARGSRRPAPSRLPGMRRGTLGSSVGLAALAAAVLAALAIGPFPIPPAALPAILSGEEEGVAATVFWTIRAPRVAAAMLLGAALAAAGAAYQGMFRNPLAAPDLLGVTAGASLGAVFGIFLGLPVLGIQGLSFAGGFAAVAMVALIAAAARRAGDPMLMLILAGIALGGLAAAGIGMLKVLADPFNELPAITFWLLGSLSAVTAADARAAAAPALLGIGVLLLRWRLNLLSLWEDEAGSLGVATTRLRAAAIAAASLAVAAATAMAGSVGWVGLVVPHAARLLAGPDLRRLLPLSALLGAAFVLAVDTAVHSAGRLELPLGVLTALLGTPFFLWLLLRGRRA